jgi:hypothetical protein
VESCKLRYFNSFEFFDHTRSSSDHQTSHNFRRPEKITYDSSGRLSRPRPFSQLGFSEVARGVLLLIDRIRPRSTH